MYAKYQKHAAYKQFFTLFLVGLIITLCLSFFAGMSIQAGAADKKKDEEPGNTSVEKLNTDGDINLSKRDAEKANLNPIDSRKAITGTLNGVYTIVAIVAVLIIITAGISIMIADGDSQKVATARKAIIYACVGLAIVGTAFIITGVVQGIGN